MKRLIFIVVILLVILLGIWAIINKKAQAPSEDVVENIANTEVSFEYESSKREETTDSYIIDMEFPVTKDSYVNEKIDQYINETADQFKSDAEEFGPHPVPGRKYTLFTNFEFKESENYKTFVFLTSVDMGGAHPNHFFKTLMFDENGSLVSLDDWMNREFENQDVIVKVSTLSQEKLKLDLGVGENEEFTWIEKGASSNIENFQNFYVLENSVHFIFEPYQVAGYAAGPREVEITFEEIRN